MTQTLRRRRLLAGFALTAFLAGLPVAVRPAEAQTLQFRSVVTTTQEMVVAANPLAAQAGADILRSGGNAIDAAIATMAVIGLVEPQSAGIGGGGFLVYYDAATRKVTTFDGRETAPAAATPTYFIGANGQPLGFSTAVLSGKSVGVPGTVRLWETMQKRYGTRPLATSIQPAIRLAQNGFAISPRMAASIAASRTSLAVDPNARAYFLQPDLTGKPAGTILRNPAYAQTLQRIAWSGAKGFYEGPVAQNIVNAVTGDTRPGGPGAMTLNDLKTYQVIERVPVCGSFRGYVVCGMGPPSSGAVAVTQILGMLDTIDSSQFTLNSLQSVHFFLQANRLAFADRNLYLADPDFVAIPTAGLVDPAYIAQRAALLTAGPIPSGLATPGTPPGAGSAQTQDVSPPNFGGTSQISIVDRFGNVASITFTVESAFGNNRLVDGFILNNELTDFSFDPGTALAPVANRVEGGKRPRSSMSPSIVFTRDGTPAFVAGSPGGASIIGTTAQAIFSMIQFGLDPQQAANEAHYQNNNGAVTTLESLFSASIPPGQTGGAPAGSTGLIGPFDVRSLAAGLQSLGWTISGAPTVLTSGLNLIRIQPGSLQGGTDPRREGLAVGQ